jgi:chromosome segregation ATPase
MERVPMDDGKEPSHNDHETRITVLERAMTGIEAEIRQLRQHMNDGFALVKVALGDVRSALSDVRIALSDILRRLDRQEARTDHLEARVERLEARMEARFDQMASLLRWTIGLLVAVLLAMLGGGIPLAGLLIQRLL